MNDGPCLLSPVCRHAALAHVPVERDPSNGMSRNDSTDWSAPARAPSAPGMLDVAAPLVILAVDRDVAPDAARPRVMRTLDPLADCAVPRVMRTVDVRVAVPDCAVPLVTRVVDATG